MSKERTWDTERAKTLLIDGASYIAAADAVGCTLEEIKKWMACERYKKSPWLEDYKRTREQRKGAKKETVSCADTSVPGGGDTGTAISADARTYDGTGASMSRHRASVHGVRLPNCSNSTTSCGRDEAA